MSRRPLENVVHPFSLASPDLAAAPAMGVLPASVLTVLAGRMLPTPTRNCAPSSLTRPSLGNICGGVPRPELVERLLGLPRGYSDADHPLVVAARTRGPALKVISVCSGIGAALYGLVLAAHDRGLPVDVVAAVELDDDAEAVHAARYPDTPVYGDACSPGVLAHLGRHEADVAIVTPPCTPFSRRRQHGPGGRFHPEYIPPGPILDALAHVPVIVWENVDGILYDDAVYLREVVEKMDSVGYRVRGRVVRASEFGAVHHRARVILVAYRPEMPSFDVPVGEVSPIPALTREQFTSEPISDEMFTAERDIRKKRRSEQLGGTVCVPVARAVGRYALDLRLGRDLPPTVDEQADEWLAHLDAISGDDDDEGSGGAAPTEDAGVAVAEARARLVYGVDVMDGIRPIRDGSVAAVMTSPPYWKAHNVTYKHGGAWGKEATFEQHCDRLVALAREWHRVLRPGGTVWMNYGDHTAADKGFLMLGQKVAERIKTAGFYLSNQAIWVKSNPGPKPNHMLRPAWEPIFVFARLGETPNLNLQGLGTPPCEATVRRRMKDHGMTLEEAQSKPVTAIDVFYAPTHHVSGRGHPCAYPPWLPEQWIKIATRPGDLILDPFSGSAATGIAALQLGRRYLGIDVQADYLGLAVTNVERASRRAGHADSAQRKAA